MTFGGNTMCWICPSSKSAHKDPSKPLRLGFGSAFFQGDDSEGWMQPCFYFYYLYSTFAYFKQFFYHIFTSFHAT